MTLLLAYARQRLTTGGLGLPVLLVTGGAVLANGSYGVSSLALKAAIAALLVSSFRIWDDVMDRPRDAIAHPDRVTVNAGSVRALVAAAAVAAAIAALLLPRIGDWRFSIGLLASLTLLLAARYRLRAGRSAMTDRVLLLKYPAFALALTSPGALLVWRGVLACVVVYLAACVHEWTHDSASPVSTRGRSVETVLLAAACIGLLLTIRGVR